MRRLTFLRVTPGYFIETQSLVHSYERMDLEAVDPGRPALARVCPGLLFCWDWACTIPLRRRSIRPANPKDYKLARSRRVRSR